MTKHYLVEQRERGVKMVLDHLDEYRPVYAACQAIGPKVGVGGGAHACSRRWFVFMPCLVRGSLDEGKAPRLRHPLLDEYLDRCRRFESCWGHTFSQVI